MPASPRLIIAPWRDLAAGLAEQLAPALKAAARLDSGFALPTIIVPGAGVGGGVIRALAERLGPAFPAPRLVTPEDFAVRITAESAQPRFPASQIERTLAIKSAARGLPAGADPIFAAPSAAAMAHRTLRDVVDSGVDPAALTRLRSGEAAPRLRHLEQIWMAYEQRLGSAGLDDPASVLQNAAGLLRSGKIHGSCTAIYGFYDATGLQSSFLRSLVRSAGVETIWIPGRFAGDDLAASYGFAARLIHELGLAVDDAHPLPASATPQTAVRVALTEERERDAVCDAVAASLEKGTVAARIAITSRSFEPDQLELWRRAAERRGIPVAGRRVVPLTATRIGRIASRLLHVSAHGCRRGDVIDLLESRLTPLRDPARKLQSILRHTREHRIASGQSRDLTSRFSGNETPEGVAAYIHALQRIESLVENVSPQMEAARWAAILRGWAEQIEIRAEDDLAPLDELEKFAASLERLGRTALAITDVAEELDSLRVMVGPDQEGVWIGDMMQIRGRWFEQLFMTGAVEGKLPQGRATDPLVPDELRQRLGVRVIGRGEAEERMLLALTIDSAHRVEISWAEATARGGSQRPSPLLVRHIVDDNPSARAEILRDPAAWVRERAGALPKPGRSSRRRAAEIAAGIPVPIPATTLDVLRMLRSAGSSGPWDGYLELDDKLRLRISERLGAISPTALERFGHCPQHFFVRSILGIQERDEPEDALELDRREKGTISHSILERFYRAIPPEEIGTALLPDGTLRKEMNDRVALIAAEVFAKENETNPPRYPHIRTVEQRQALQKLRMFLADDLKKLSESGFVPRHFEFTFGDLHGETGDAPAIDLQFGSLRLRIRGTIDRVDVHPDGRVRIVDYKAGKTDFYRNLGERVARGESLQLALYCRAWSELFEVPADRLSAQILSIADPVVRAPGFEYGELAEGLERTIERFSTAILEGRFPAFPGTHCSFCPVGAGCSVRNDPQAALELQELGDVMALLWPDEVRG